MLVAHEAYEWLELVIFEDDLSAGTSSKHPRLAIVRPKGNLDDRHYLRIESVLHVANVIARFEFPEAASAAVLTMLAQRDPLDLL